MSDKCNNKNQQYHVYVSPKNIEETAIAEALRQLWYEELEDGA